VVAANNYAYDGWKTDLDSNGNAPSFVGLENFDVLADLSSTNTLVTRRLYGDTPNDVVARISSAGVVAYYTTDYQGSVIGMLNGSGTVQATVVYDGFGNIKSNSNSSFTDIYGFQGERLESATNMVELNARWMLLTYDKFITTDPMGFAAGDADLTLTAVVLMGSSSFVNGRSRS
jgi:hypothetical protein